MRPRGAGEGPNSKFPRTRRPRGDAQDQEQEKLDEERLARLERKGLITRGTGDLRAWLKTHKPIKIPGGAGVLQALLEERESGW